MLREMEAVRREVLRFNSLKIRSGRRRHSQFEDSSFWMNFGFGFGLWFLMMIQIHSYLIGFFVFVFD